MAIGCESWQELKTIGFRKHKVKQIQIQCFESLLIRSWHIDSSFNSSMDHTNISRYENPPEQAQYSALSQLNSKEDYLDVFVVGLLHRSPIIYVLINITLLIWLAQTMISSKIQQIPKSAFLISPYLGQYPIKDILVTSEENCPNEWQQIMLRTFPSIAAESLATKKMYRWGVDGNMTFCVKRINPALNLIDSQGKCSQKLSSCSGYCFADSSECPITSINILNSEVDNIKKYQKVFYTTQAGARYISSKQEGRPIINLIAAFRTRCSNDYHYMETFENLTEYEKILTNCGNQATINGIYDKITQMKTQTFMYINNRPFVPAQLILHQIQLGEIHSIDFNNDVYGECGAVKLKANQAKDYFSSEPGEPIFKKSLLVIGFILMIAQIIWLMIYVCVNGYFHQKNIIVILICVIELTVITFIYSENSKVFQTQQFIRSIANCIETQVVAASTWNFGLQSSGVFTMIQYMGTIFLAHYLFAYLMDKIIFEPSSQIYRSYSYDENDRSPPVEYAMAERT